MKTHAKAIVVAVILVFAGCRRSSEETRQLLVGRYGLQEFGSDCGKVQRSFLVLRTDGTYDRHIQFSSGTVVDEMNQRWTYDGGDIRGKVHFSNFRIDATGDLNEHAPETEVSLVADLRHPVVILLKPDDSCVYTRPK